MLAKHGDEALPVIKNGDSLVKSVFGLDDSAAESFIKIASKQDDAFFEAIAKSSDPDKVAKYVADHGNGAAYIVSKFGNNGIDYANISSDTMYNILSKGKSNRPDPSTYLTKNYIENHLKQFDDGAVYLVSKNDYLKWYKNADYIARNDGTMFVMPKNYYNKVINDAQGNVSYIENALGYAEGSLSNGEYVAIHIDQPQKYNLCIPSGNEAGANSYWIPGGCTSGGVPEAIVNYVPNNNDCIHIETIKF